MDLNYAEWKNLMKKEWIGYGALYVIILENAN